MTISCTEDIDYWPGERNTFVVFHSVYISSYLKFYFIYLYLNVWVVNIPFFV